MKLSYQTYQIGQSPLNPSGIFCRPEAPLFLPGAATVSFYSALLDTGADHCILPESQAVVLGINLEGAEQLATAGFSGDEVMASLAPVSLQISEGGQTFAWSAVVAFVPFAEPEDEMVILGHVGCLEYFRVTFDGEAREVELVPTPAFPASVS